MDNWKDHIIFHTIAFVIFTMPLLWVVNTFVLHESFVEMLPWCLLGVIPTVFVLGLIKFGLPLRRD